MTAFLDTVHLLRPWALLLIVPAMTLWWLGRQASDTTRRWRRVMDPELLAALTVGAIARRRLTPHDLLLLGSLAAILAVAGPTWRHEPSPFGEQAAPAMVVLKVGPSMMTADLAPTRLDRARQKLADILAARDGMPAGLIAYSGSAHLVLPPTQDHDVVTGMAGALSPAIMPRDGDRLADAVARAADVLREGGRGGSILVIADTMAPGQAEALRRAVTGGPAVTILAVAPPAAIDADHGLAQAVEALDARLVPATIDNDDVARVARRLAAESANTPVLPGETVRWQEAGYWLTPFVALIVLLWFRRGWMIAT